MLPVYRTRVDPILVELAGGECRQIPKAWTSLAAPDLYSLLSAPPLLRTESLLELAEWIQSQRDENRTKPKSSKEEHLPTQRSPVREAMRARYPKDLEVSRVF